MFSLSKSELRQLIAAVNLAHPFGPRDYCLFNFMYHTALRVDECAHLITSPRRSQWPAPSVPASARRHF